MMNIGMLSELILHRWTLTKAEVWKDMQPYWSFRYEIAIIEGITMKGRRIIMPAVLQDKAQKLLNLNLMGVEKTRLLACESIYWINMNVDIEEMVQNWPKYIDYQATQPKDKILSHEIPGRPSNIVGAAILTINNKYYLSNVFYHRKLPVIN